MITLKDLEGGEYPVREAGDAIQINAYIIQAYLRKNQLTTTAYNDLLTRHKVTTARGVERVIKNQIKLNYVIFDSAYRGVRRIRIYRRIPKKEMPKYSDFKTFSAEPGIVHANILGMKTPPNTTPEKWRWAQEDFFMKALDMMSLTVQRDGRFTTHEYIRD